MPARFAALSLTIKTISKVGTSLALLSSVCSRGRQEENDGPAGNRNEWYRTVERFSRRIQNGVEIVEKETISSIRVENGSYINSKPRLPRLVISDAVVRSKDLISKSRNQIADLNHFLRSITRRPADAK